MQWGEKKGNRIKEWGQFQMSLEAYAGWYLI